MSTNKVIGSEVVNDQVDQGQDWSTEMKKSDIWTSSAQNRLALQLKVESEANQKDIRKVQKGDTLGAIAKALTGSLNWSQKVDYRSSKLSSKQKPNRLSEANLIYPDQYVWVESGNIIVADQPPVTETPVEPVPVKVVPVETVPHPSECKPAPVVEPERINPEKDDTPVIPPVIEEKEEREDPPVVAPEKIPEVVTPKPLKPIAREDFLRGKLESIEDLPNLRMTEPLRERALGILEETGIHPGIDFSATRWPTDRNSFVRQVIEETGDAYFALYHVSETEFVGGIRRPKVSGNLESNAPEIVAQVPAPKSRIMGFDYTLLGRSGEVLVQSVFDDSPAEKAGLKPGDIIVKLNGQKPANLISQRGFVASQDEILLSVKREGRAGLVDFRVEPEKLDRLREADTEELGDDVLLVKGPFGFSESLTEDFENKLRESGRRSIVLDLRGNPGGLINEAKQLGDKLRSLNDQGFKIVILTNGRTASASEILAAEAQEGGWAKVIGEKTYGKHVQQVTETIGEYVITYTTGFHSMGEKVPVIPDIETESGEALATALRQLRPTS